MVRTFCDRCGRVIAGASKLGGATVRAADEHGNEIIKLDFCAFCADWAVNKLLRKALTERHEDELLRYKERTGAGWAVRIGKATGGKVNSEVVRAIVTDGLVADMAVWRGIAKALETLRKEEREAT